MPDNLGVDNALFNTLIPSIDENADIQTAFRYYHYGEGLSGAPGTIKSESISGYLNELTEGKINKDPVSLPINADLDDYTESGFYVQSSNSRARSGSNYPLAPPAIGFAYAGMMTVINDGSNVFQQYNIGGIPNGQAYWRSKFGGSAWSPWTTYAVDGHVHDERYYQKQQSDDRYLPAIKYLNIRQPALNNNNYTLSLLDETALVMIDGLSLPNNVYVPTNNAVPFVVGTQITILQKNLGQTTILGDPGVTVNSTPANRLRAQWSSASLIKIGTNEWVLVGDLA